MKNIFVGNLSYSTTEEMLLSLFEKYGTVDRVNIVKDRDTGQARGFAFVEMSDDADAVRAINALNGTQLEDRRVNVNEPRPEMKRPGGRGGSGRKRW